MDILPPILQCYAVRNDKAKVLEWRSESRSQGVLPRTVGGPQRSTALAHTEDDAIVLKAGLKRLYPRDGKGNRKAFDGLIQQAWGEYWSGLAERFRRLPPG